MRRLAEPRWGRQTIDKATAEWHPKKVAKLPLRGSLDVGDNAARWDRGLPNLDEQDGNGDGEK